MLGPKFGETIQKTPEELGKEEGMSLAKKLTKLILNKMSKVKMKQCPKCHEYPLRTRGTDDLYWVEHFCLVDKHYYCMQIQAWNMRSK